VCDVIRRLAGIQPPPRTCIGKWMSKFHFCSARWSRLWKPGTFCVNTPTRQIITVCCLSCKCSQICNRPVLSWPQLSSAQLPVRYLLYSFCPLAVWCIGPFGRLPRQPLTHSSFMQVQDPYYRLADRLLVSCAGSSRKIITFSHLMATRSLLPIQIE